MRRNAIFVTARRFYLDHFHISAHSFKRGGERVKEVYATFPSQIYSSYLRDYITNSLRNIKVFSNAIKNLVVSLLWKISLIHLKCKLYSLSKERSVFAFLLICACAEFISKYVLTWKHVKIEFLNILSKVSYLFSRRSSKY